MNNDDDDQFNQWLFDREMRRQPVRLGKRLMMSRPDIPSDHHQLINNIMKFDVDKKSDTVDEMFNDEVMKRVRPPIRLG